MNIFHLFISKHYAKLKYKNSFNYIEKLLNCWFQMKISAKAIFLIFGICPIFNEGSSIF